MVKGIGDNFNKVGNIGIDVFIPTLNCEKTIIDVLEGVKNAGVPVHRIINTDANSNDRTVLLLKQHCKILQWDCISIQCDKGIGVARFKGLPYVETEFFLSLDADVILTSNAFYPLYSRLIHNPEYYFASTFVIYGKPGNVIQSIYKYRAKKKQNQYCIGATLMRTKLTNFDLIKNVIWGEDTIYCNDLRLKGKKFYVDYLNLSFHERGLIDDLHHCFMWGTGAKMSGRNFFFELAKTFYRSIESIKVAYNEKDFRVVLWVPLREFSHLLGYIFGKSGELKLTSRMEWNLLKGMDNNY